MFLKKLYQENEMFLPGDSKQYFYETYTELYDLYNIQMNK